MAVLCVLEQKQGYFGSKRLFCKLLIVRGKVRVRHRAETTILLPVCNRLFWLLNGCTERLVRLPELLPVGLMLACLTLLVAVLAGKAACWLPGCLL